MAVIVPMSKLGAKSQPSTPPPNSTFALMAAALMHQQGRLVTQPQDQSVADPR